MSRGCASSPAFCSTDNRETTALAVGDMTDPGYVLEFFNPRACTDGFGFGGVCFSLDQMSWYGYQGDGVAYGYAPYRAGSPLHPRVTERHALGGRHHRDDHRRERVAGTGNLGPGGRLPA